MGEVVFVVLTLGGLDPEIFSPCSGKVGQGTS